MKLDGGVLIANITPFLEDLGVDWADMARRARDLGVGSGNSRFRGECLRCGSASANS